MIMSFTRNDQSAKQLDVGSFITQSGAYVGIITQAAMCVSDAGAQYLDIAFKCEDGRLCQSKLFLTKRDGSEAFGRRILDALMAVLGISTADVVEADIYWRDKDAPGGVIKQRGYKMPSIEKKRLGLVIQRENSEYNGRPTYKMNILTPFNPDTRMVAKEILEGAKEPKLLDARLKNLKDRDTTGQSGTQPANHPAVSASVDDDPPF